METGVQPVQAVHELTDAEIDAILREKVNAGRRRRYARNPEQRLQLQRTPEARMKQAQRQRDRYAADPQYRERRKAFSRKQEPSA